jgi:hypothetical protein
MPWFSGNHNVHYIVHKNPTLSPILRQLNPVQTVPPHFLEIQIKAIRSTPQSWIRSLPFRFCDLMHVSRAPSDDMQWGLVRVFEILVHSLGWTLNWEPALTLSDDFTVHPRLTLHRKGRLLQFLGFPFHWLELSGFGIEFDWTMCDRMGQELTWTRRGGIEDDHCCRLGRRVRGIDHYRLTRYMYVGFLYLFWASFPRTRFSFLLPWYLGDPLWSILYVMVVVRSRFITMLCWTLCMSMLFFYTRRFWTFSRLSIAQTC